MQQQFQPAYGAIPPGYIQKAPGTHNVTLVIVLSLLCFVGIGQVLNGQVAKGLVLFGAAIVLSIVSAGLLLIPIYVLTIVDAILVAQKLNRGMPVREWQWF